MKKLLRITFGILLVAGLVFTFTQKNKKSNIEILREKHQAFLDNSPFKKTKKLSRSERKNLGLPPNAYNEQLWELTMDPNTGRPMPERVYKLQQELKKKRKGLKLKAPGGVENPWVDRGPNNIGGRTRGIMFDPNDTTNKRVFSGGVSGGLWVNQDITDENSSWTLVEGIVSNIAVTTIIHDPNNPNTFYIGSGESYTSGDAVGNGIWKSSDAGVTWTNILGGADGTLSSDNQIINGIFYVNDIVARNVSGETELYAAIAGAFYADAGQFHGLEDQGLYKSIDNGTTWNKISINESNDKPSNPNDLEIDLNNNIWLSTTRSSYGDRGGKIFKSIDGQNFELKTTIAETNRTELEVSSKDANKLWVATNTGGQADLYITKDGFETIEQLPEPNDADTGIPETDYTRGQAFYDLPIEVDSGDRLYVGGIDLFRSGDDGQTWTQISKWSNNNNLSDLNIPLIHADQHAIVFRPGNDGQAVFGHDGGITFTSNLISMSTDPNAAQSRNKNYNVTQFYYGSIDNRSESKNIFYGGTQDNGTLISQNSAEGANSFNNYFSFFSGDGSYSEIDQNGGLEGFGNGEYLIVGSVFASYYVASPETSSIGQAFNEGYQITVSGNREGNFINPAELDFVSNILYANTSEGSTVRFSAFVLDAESATRKDYTNTLLTSQPTSFKVSPFNNKTLLIGTRTGNLLKVDEVQTLQTFSDISGPDFVGSISDIEYGETDQDIFVTFHNYGIEGNIWYTNDGGTTWNNIEGDFPDIPVKCILQNPLNPKELIIGSQLGIWKTSDYTTSFTNWVQSFNGMSDVTVLDLDLKFSDNTVLATTYGRGMFTGKFEGSTASVEDVITDNKAFTIYPTISKGNFTVFAKKNLGKINMNIYNLNGKEVYSANLDFSAKEKQPVSVNLSAGVYVVNVVDQNNKKSSNKIIIE